MKNRAPELSAHSPQADLALLRWDNEGGATACEPPATLGPHESPLCEPEMNNAELVQLRIRVIALENLLVALLADASEAGLSRARGMVNHISPRPGFTHHPITLHAAALMVHLVGRAGSFHAVPIA